MRVALAVVVAGLSAAPCAYSQDVPKGVLPGRGSYFCEIDVTWPGEARPSPAISKVERVSDNLILIRVGKRHVYSFPTMEQSWAYVSDEILMAVSGSQYGDDVTDTFTYRNRTRSWDTKQNKSEIGQAEIRLFNAVAKQLIGCERIPAKK
jgi:hypothetical protein